MRDLQRASMPEQSSGVTTLLISADELATILGTSKRTVWRLLSAGLLPRPVHLGKSTRWRLDEVHRWIDSGCPTANNSPTATRRNRKEG
ncbi:MAG: helix-turn-helix domain-containing protein [Pirellulales bacterium]|nr:helix-turn-helix domain-containing protein [Pirellulales bacterium]